MAEVKFRGIIPPMLTVFRGDGSFDWEGNRCLIDHLVTAGVNGIFVLGSSGEFTHLSTAERKQFAEFAVEYVNGRIPLIVGTGSSNSAEALELTRHAKEVGADGAAVISPFYWGLSEEALYRHYALLAEAVNIPLILYHFPALTGQNIPASLVSRLATDFPHICGIKDTFDNVAHVRELILQVKGMRPEFSVLTGYDDHLLNTLALGGDGGITALTNFAPELTTGLYGNFVAGNLAGSMNFYRRIRVLNRIYDLDKPALGVLKEACRLCGVEISPYVRQPALRPQAETLKALKLILRDAGLINPDATLEL